MHKKENENNDLCNVLMPSEDNKIIKLNPYQKSDKTIIWYLINLLFKQILNV